MLITPDNNYTLLQKCHYNGGTSDHVEHNDNADYWYILLGPITDTDNKGKKALDFGCGKGRNVQNLKQFGFERIDGVDISAANINYCKTRFSDYTFYENNGVDLKDIQDSEYDFVMSTIVFQHIPVFDVRHQLLRELYRVMKEDGIFSFQMGFGDNIEPGHTKYHDNFWTAGATNGGADVQITDKKDIIEDLINIGFKNITTRISNSFLDNSHKQWIYIKCEK